MNRLQLYSYFRSSAAFRVRIALYLKNLSFEYIPIHLLKDGGEQNSSAYKELNPMGEVPTLVDGPLVLGQSMAILQYLDETHPNPLLFPSNQKTKAKILQFCESINSGIHPIQNLKVMQELEKRFGANQEQKTAWAAFWIERGFKSLELFLQHTAGSYCFAGNLTAADLFLVPQVYNALRYKVDMTPFPHISGIYQRCMGLPAFRNASPEKQPDYQE